MGKQRSGLRSQKLTFAPRLDASIAALVRVAAARRGRTRKCDIGIGTGGGGACRKPSGASPLRSIVRHAPRSAASSGQRAGSRSKVSIALATVRP